MTNAELKAIVQREEYDFLRTNKHLGSNILFLTLSGSHAYGSNVEGSDIDIRGVAGSPEILGFNRFEQAIDNRTDTVIYAVNKFVGLLAQGNPNIIELLGNDPELLAIRNGKYLREDGSYAPEFFEFVDALEKKFQDDVRKTSLPAKPDFGKIEELLVEINKEYLRRVM